MLSDKQLRRAYDNGFCAIARPESAMAESRADGLRAVEAAVRADMQREVQTVEVVTLCGSTKFKDEIHAENQRLTLEGKLVISLGVFGHTDLPDYDWSTDTSDLKRELDALHRQKIDLADSVHVVNPGGYIGRSTRREIDYALSLGKPVTYLVTPSTPNQQGAEQ